MPLTTEYTTFTRDVLGRYVCNTFDEMIVRSIRIARRCRASA